MYQSPLFALDAPVEAPSITWSKSRREVFEQCLRRYYYAYYGSHTRQALNDPDKAILRRLKRLTGLVLRAGDLLHLALRRTLESRRDGRPVHMSPTLRWVRESFSKDLTELPDSPGLPDQDQLGEEGEIEEPGPLGRRRFVEFFYGHPDAEAKATQELERLERSLTALFSDPALSHYLSRVTPESLIEAKLRLTYQGASISGKLDFGFWEGGRFNIVDWKIGKVGGVDEDIQLLVYAYLAAESLDIDPELISASRVHLSEGVVIEQAVNATLLRRARARVQQDLERMQAVHQYGHDGVVEVFTPRAEPNICTTCPFQLICPKE